MLASLTDIERANWARFATPCLAVLGKGGAGKSAVTANVAVAALERGLRVGVIDADPQRSLSDWRRLRPSGDIPVRSASPDDVERHVAAARRGGFDMVIVDTAPELGPGLKAALDVADFALIVTRPATFDLLVTQKRIQMAKTLGRPFGVLINAAPPKREGREAPFVVESRDCLRAIGGRLWTGQITTRHAVPLALAAGRGVAESDPRGPSADEYRALLTALQAQLAPTKGVTREEEH